MKGLIRRKVKKCTKARSRTTSTKNLNNRDEKKELKFKVLLFGVRKYSIHILETGENEKKTCFLDPAV